MSTRLSKFFIYKVLFGRLNYIKKKEVKSFTVNDFGCGDGMLLRYFNFKKYIGIDLNKSKITKLKREFTNKNYLFFNENIINFKNNTQNKISICMETFGFNTKFRKKNFIKCIKNILNSTQKNGYFFFNITSDLYSEDMDKLLKMNFYNIEKINYGFFNNRLPILLVRYFWFLEYFFLSKKNIFFMCIKKK